MLVKRLSCFLAIAVASVLAPNVVAQSTSPERVDIAIQRATPVLDKAAANYPTHRSCFSCHHQALPLLANSVGRVNQPERRETFYKQSSTREVLDFTIRAFFSKRATLNQGADIGGKALTVAYGLWALDLAGAEVSDTSLAMVEYLLKTQSKDGAWDFQSLRPPAASSRAMTSAVAVYGLRAYGHGATEEDRLQSAYQRAWAWTRQLNEQQSHEDLIGQVWLEHMLHEELGVHDAQREQSLQTKLWTSQREDGGWAQTADLSSDAYATGQALTLLAQVVQDKENLHSRIAYQRGIEFLLDSQQPDGSWLVKTRSKPVQIFFDNGDPHGEHQFISVMATSWATAALREFSSKTCRPLESPRVHERVVHRK